MRKIFFVSQKKFESEKDKLETEIQSLTSKFSEFETEKENMISVLKNEMETIRVRVNYSALVPSEFQREELFLMLC